MPGTLFRLLLCLVLVSVFAGSALAAMKDEPKEFLGVPFGKEYKPDHSFSCETDSEEGVSCTRAGDDLHLAGVPVRSLIYLFMYKRLYTVDLDVSGRDNYDRIAAELAKRHGKPKKLSGGMLSFEGSQVDIMLYFDAERGAGEVSYIFKNLPCPVE